MPTETASAKAVLNHVLEGGGKRIRPALFFMCCRVLDYRGDHYYSIAAVTELVHTASLLHDDVVDDSTLRRNKPTANSVYGDETSVLVGDLIYSTASEMMAATGDMEVVKTFARAIRLMSDGELRQLENVFNPNVSEATVTSPHPRVQDGDADRGGVQIRGPPRPEPRRRPWIASCASATASAWPSSSSMTPWTIPVPEPAVVGKARRFSDLPEGKITLPVILLKDLATEAELARIAKVLSGWGWIMTGRARSRAWSTNSDTASLTVDRAHAFTLSAMAALQTLPPGPDRDVLENLANKLLFRFN